MKYLLFIILLVAAILTAGCSENDDKKCNGIEYDSGTQTCCGGILFQSQKNFNCCGQDYYYWYYADEKHFAECCSSASTYKPNDLEGEVYNPWEKHCCNGRVEPGGGPWNPCGNTCYNMDTQSCCDDTIHEKDYYCCLKDCPKGMKCCRDFIKGPTCYNPETEVCKTIK